MCIRHHTHWSVESVSVRGTTGSQSSLSWVRGRGRRVVETWTTHMSDQGIEDRGHGSRWSDSWWSETPTDQYIIYNIKDGPVCKLVSSSEKRPCWTWPGLCSSTPPSPQGHGIDKKMLSTLNNILIHKISIRSFCYQPTVEKSVTSFLSTNCW